MGDPQSFQVEEFAFIGRTFEEYRRMFDLRPADRTRTILDCPAGPGAFVPTANRRGMNVVGVDVGYDRAPATVADRCESDYEAVAAELRRTTHLFSWSYYGDVDTRLAHLESAFHTFLEDFGDPQSDGTYLAARLPTLPFEDDAFSLVLSAHLLFLYGDRLDYAFHRDALLELARVARHEVRVFPLVGLDTEPYPRLDEVRDALASAGYETSRREVPFEFQRGATQMLVVDC